MLPSYKKMVFLAIIMLIAFSIYPVDSYAAAPPQAEITILAAETNKPLPDALVELFPNDRAARPLQVMKSDREGKLWPKLPKGNYRYLVRLEGYGISTGYLYIDGKEKAISSSWLNKAANLSGRLVDSNGNGISGIRLSMDGLHQATSGPDGRFRFDALDAHGHSLTIEDAGWTFDKPAYPQLSAGESKNMGDIPVRRAAVISIRLKLSDHSRLTSPSGTGVSLSGNGVWRSGKTNADGILELGSLPPGNYTVATTDSHLNRTEQQVSLEEGKRHELTLQITPRPPSLEIEEYGDLFLPGKAVNLKVNGLWTSSATATLFRIPAETVLSGRLEPGHNPSLQTDTLKPVKSFTVKMKPSRNGTRYSGKIAMPPMQPGAYLLSIKGSEAKGSMAFLVTRLGLVAKVAPDSTLIMASDLITGRPLANVAITGRMADDASLSGKGKAGTGNDGTVIWDIAKQGSIIIGQSGDNLAIMPLANAESRERQPETKGYIYTERTAYRPGQTVYFKGIVRNIAGDGYSLPTMKTVRVKIIDPGEKMVHEASIAVNRFGSFSGSFTLAATPSLGEYGLTATGGDEIWNGSFKVLEYRKPEFEVKLSPLGEHHLGGRQVPVRIAGRYYFGAPVAGGKVSWRAYTTPLEPWGEDEAGGGFGTEQHQYGGYGEFVGEGEATLDENGEALLQITSKTNPVPVTYQIEADITDQGARRVAGETRFTVVPAMVDVRIKSEQYLLKPGQKAGFTVKVSDWKGNVKPGVPVKISVEEQRYDKKRRISSWHETGVLSGRTGSDGYTRLEHIFPRTGYWRLTAKGNDAEGRTSIRETFAWVWKDGSSWDGNYRELQAELDHRIYRPGDTARLIVRSPAKGATMLLTLEGRRIHQRNLIKLASAVQVVEIPVTEELAPNIHLSAVVIHGGRFFQQNGLLKVDLQPGRLDLAVKPEREIYRPGDRVRIKVQSSADGKPARPEISLAVVDEAIFAVAPEIREEIYSFFRGRRDHRITTIHSFPRLYLGGASKDAALKEAGDEMKGLKTRKLFKDTAAWFPILETGPDGTITAELDLPDNLTTWRATAVGHTADSLFGSGRAAFKVRLPFMARLNPPRFLTAGDRLQIPGILTDMSGNEQQVSGRFESERLALSGESSFIATIPGGGTLRRDITVMPQNAGQAVLRFSGKGAEGGDSLELAIPVQHRSLQREELAGISTKGSSGETTLNLPPDAEAGSGVITATFSPGIASSLTPALERLISFPYGCTEQTLSRFLPAVYAARLLGENSGVLTPETAKKLPMILSEGLRRLGELQHTDGGWGWWKGDNTKAEITAMVMTGVAAARRSGLVVDDTMLKRGLKSLEEQIRQAKPLQTALLYRALALNGGKSEQADKKLARDWKKLSAEGKIAWADALLEMKRNSEAMDLLSELKNELRQEGTASFMPEDGKGWRWGSSSIEMSAALLSTLLRTGGQEAVTSRIAEYLTRRQAGGWWRTTAGSSAAVMALAEYIIATGEMKADYNAELRHNGQPVAFFKVNSGRITKGERLISIPSSQGRNQLQLLRDNPSGNAYVAGTLNYRLPIEKTATTPGIKVERSIYRISSARTGDTWRNEYTPIKPGDPVKVGEDIEIRITVRNDRELEYVILEDRLPAGFELRQTDRDPRYSNEAFYQGWYDHRERRDNLMAWFIGRLPAGSHEFRSIVYPELAGSVTALPASLWPMYSPELRSESRALKIEILPPGK